MSVPLSFGDPQAGDFALRFPVTIGVLSDAIIMPLIFSNLSAIWLFAALGEKSADK